VRQRCSVDGTVDYSDAARAISTGCAPRPSAATNPALAWVSLQGRDVQKWREAGGRAGEGAIGDRRQCCPLGARRRSGAAAAAAQPGLNVLLIIERGIKRQGVWHLVRFASYT